MPKSNKFSNKMIGSDFPGNRCDPIVRKSLASVVSHIDKCFEPNGEVCDRKGFPLKNICIFGVGRTGRLQDSLKRVLVQVTHFSARNPGQNRWISSTGESGSGIVRVSRDAGLKALGRDWKASYCDKANVLLF